MNQNDYPLTLTTQEVMQILRCSRGKAYEVMRSKGFPKLQNGRKIIIPRDAFFDWLNTKSFVPAVTVSDNVWQTPRRRGRPPLSLRNKHTDRSES